MNMMTQLKNDALFVDQFGRGKRKLRISVTDRCNFKCVYCMPEHPEWMKKQDLLSFEALKSPLSHKVWAKCLRSRKGFLFPT